jgi:hypothetical protein
MYTLYMKQKIYKKILLSLFLIIAFSIPVTVFAQIEGVGDQVTDKSLIKGVGDQVTDKDKAPITTDTKNEPIKLVINNPLGVTSIEEMIQKIMSMIVKLAVPVIICFFLYSGFMFITAQGDKKKLDTAKKMFFQVVIGSVIILGAWTIASAIVSTVNLITG